MKKILTVFVFFSLLVVGLLATVDLSPYLAPERLPEPLADSQPATTNGIPPAIVPTLQVESPEAPASTTAV